MLSRWASDEFSTDWGLAISVRHFFLRSDQLSPRQHLALFTDGFQWRSIALAAVVSLFAFNAKRKFDVGSGFGIGDELFR